MDILLLFKGAMGLPSFININLYCYCVFLRLEAIIILVTDEATCEEQQFLECSFLHLGEWASHCFSGLPQSSSSSSSLNASSLWLLPLKTKGKATLLKQIFMLIGILLVMVLLIVSCMARLAGIVFILFMAQKLQILWNLEIKFSQYHTILEV